jgi:D-amino-acid dehydrogenase
MCITPWLLDVRVAVLGAGVIGVTSAYYLARAGHEVVVVDRQAAPAMETSFANAGEISPGYASPWAGPGIPLKALKWLLMKHTPLIVRYPLSIEAMAWMAAVLRNCTRARYAVNKDRMVRLAEFSREQLLALRASTNITYDQRMRGTLQLFRTRRQLDDVSKDTEVLRDGGVPFEILDRAGCVTIEPGLSAVAQSIVGGLRLPNDETGDCFKFTTQLAQITANQGVRYQFNTVIDKLLLAANRVEAAQTSVGDIGADAFVVALGSYSTRLLQLVGLRVPIYPVKGYSITVPVIDESRAPESTIMDETYKVAITRLGNRIRVGGMAEISGFNNRLDIQRRRTLEYSVGSLFPGAGDIVAGTFWSGLRPMTPDGPPIVGATRLPNLFVNAGHGTLGWTMACGSGRILADIVSATRPAIDLQEFSIARYDRG